ncbi:MAG TPA: PLP-dependent aminotransferase family protein [Acetobacteraceae bacterium]|nr:PLP-dependent aminotransferase family protein [Acetobacteraceae bacterium]
MIAIDRASPRPIGTQLYVALRDLILSGAVANGTRLPATRTLADEIGVSRTTVIEAFDRLVADGIVTSRVGAGTVVSVSLDLERPSQMPALAATPCAPRLSQAAQSAVDHLAERPRLPHAPRAFVTGLPAFDAFPMAQWSRIAARHWRGSRRQIMGYGPPLGDPRLRRAIAAHLGANRGIACEPDQVVIVSGAQQAFLNIGTLLLDPGDPVWFENPGAIGARNGLLSVGARLVPVPVDEDGIQVAEGLRRCPDFRLVFVTPSHQQPLGHIMSIERRLALLRAAHAAGAWIIEDDYDGEFCFGRRPVSTLKSIDHAGAVLYVGTFSKSLFPALRLGFIVVPTALIDPLARISSAANSGVPSSLQGIVAEFMEEGHFATHIRRMRRIYEERHAALLHAAHDFAGLLEVRSSDSGLHTVGFLQGGLSEQKAALAAEARQIVVAPLARYSIEPVALKGFALGFGGVRPHEIGHGMRILGEALEQLATARRRSRAA